MHTDNNVFRLHYPVTVLLIFAFCLMVTIKQYVGDPIKCAHSTTLPNDLVDTFCWIHTTFTVPSTFGKKSGSDVSQTGIGTSTEKRDRKYHRYYQWVAFTLLFQGILFYTPRWLWIHWEGGKIHALMMNLDIAVCSEGEKSQKKKVLVDYLMANFRHHDWYAYKYFFCECMCFANVLGQLWLLNKFFDNQFLTYGIDMIDFIEKDQEDRVDPMIKIFPRVAKCIFHTYGLSGNVQNNDVMCILPLNVVNEKIYIFLWFWFIILSALTGTVLIFRVIILICPPVRIYLLHMRFGSVNHDHLNTVVRRGSIGDWFIIYMLGQNVDTIVFKEVIADMARKMTTHPKEALSV